MPSINLILPSAYPALTMRSKQNPSKMRPPSVNVVRKLCWIFFIIVGIVENRKMSGPSQYVIKSLEKCESLEGHKLMLDKYRITKYNRTVYTYNGNMTLIEELGDEGTEVNFSLEVWGNGGWRKNFFNKRFNKTCTVLEQYSPKYIDALRKKTNVTECPLPEGTYEIKDLVINLDMAVSMPYGLFRITVEFFKDSEIFFCMRLILDVLPVK